MGTYRTTNSQPILNQTIHPVIVFLCTPRCGTQWIVKNINENYSDEAIARHEPVGNEYYPRINLGSYDKPVDLPENPKINEHLDFIGKTIQNKRYIEVGWQSIAGLGQIYGRFGERMKFIHLFRNPVNVAASMVTHSWYTGKNEDRYEKGELNPFDNSSLLSDYRERWNDLTLYEKSLYYWTEINLRALEIRQRFSTVPFYSLKFEDLFEESKEKSRITLIEFLAFMGLKYDKKMSKALDMKYDEYQYKTTVKINWKNLYDHPQTMILANKLGYSFDNEINVSRYEMEPLYKRVIKRIKSELSRIFDKG